MRVEDLIVEVRDSSLERVGQLRPQDLVGLKAVLRFNNVGSWELSIPENHALADALTTPGAGLLITGPDGVILSGPVTGMVNEKTSEDPEGTWQIQGVDDSVILGERLAYPDPSTADVTAQAQSHDVRNDLASTIMYGYVEDNIGAYAPVERQAGVTSATDTGLGSTIYKSARFDVLGQLLSEIASIDGLGFDLKQNGSTLQFSVFSPVDRSGEIRMDVANNTLSKSGYGYGSPGATLAIVAGQGEGINRQFLEITTTESVAAETLWGRRIESFIDQRNSADTAELTQAGREALAENGVTITSIDVTPSSDVTMAYGVDWNLGDRVTVVVADQELAAIVTQVALSIEPDGVRVGATVGEPTGVDYEAVISKRQTTQSKKISQLERKEVPAIVWNDTDGTYEFTLKGGNVTLQLGQEQVAYVKNNTGATLTKGTAVYPNGSTGTNKLVAKAQANAESTSSKTFGVLAEDIANGQHGFVATFGMVENINTSALTEGGSVYLSPTTAGELTSTKPSAPNHMVLIGFCVRSHAVNGSIFVKVENGFELDELHDVAIGTKADNNILAWDSASSTWKNQTAANAGVSEIGHVHATTDITSGTFGVARGGTGATTFTSGAYLKGAGTSAITTQTGIPADDITSGALAIAYGGTGVTTGAGMFPIIPTSPNYGAGTGSISSNGLLTFTNASLVQVLCFSSTYSRYRIYLDIQSCSVNDYVYWRGVNAASAQVSTSVYNTGTVYQQSNSVAAYDNGNTALSYSRIGYATNDDASSYIMDILNPFQARKTKGHFVSQYSGAGLTNLSGSYVFNATTSFSGIRFAPLSSGTWSGTMRVFGIL